MLYYTILYCVMLCCTILYYTILCYLSFRVPLFHVLTCKILPRCAGRAKRSCFPMRCMLYYYVL